MEVRKFDILESILVAGLSDSYARNLFTYAGVLPCIIFAIGINFGTSLVWTILLTSMLSLFSLFRGRTVLVWIIGIAVFYGSLCLHGLSIHELILGKGTNFKTADPVTKGHLNSFRSEYDRFSVLKEKLMPVMENLLADPETPEEIRQATTQYIASMESVEAVNKDFIKLSKKKRISLEEFNRIDGYIKQVKTLNASLADALSSVETGKQRQQEEEYYRQTQQNRQSNADVTSYFNGCDTWESVKTRYRDLCKVYHPDMGNGSPEEFAKIQKEYEVLKERYN